jgi:hypothetical protein
MSLTIVYLDNIALPYQILFLKLDSERNLTFILPTAKCNGLYQISPYFKLIYVYDTGCQKLNELNVDW